MKEMVLLEKKVPQRAKIYKPGGGYKRESDLEQREGREFFF